MGTIKYMLRRMAVAIIDYGMFFDFIYAYLYAFGEIRSEGYYGTKNILHQLVILFVWLIIFPILESGLGYSLGKGAFDLKVIQNNGKKPNFSRALIRHLMDPIDVFVFLLIGIATVRTTPQPRRLGAYVAGTEVRLEG